MTTSTTEISRLASITASERAVEVNAETRVWLAAAEGRGACLIVEEAGFWAGMGIVTGLDFERDGLASAISDTYKERHGIRPRWMNFGAMSLPQLEAELDSLTAEPVEEDVWEAQAQAECEGEEAAQFSEEDVWWTAQERLEVGAR